MEYIKHDVSNRKITIDYENIINHFRKRFEEENIILDKKFWEEFYLKGLGLTEKDGKIIWKDNNIAGFQFYQTIEKVSFTIKIDKNGEISYE